MQNLFKALADDSRRHLLDRLSEQGGLTLGELCKELDMSRQAVTKHLRILERANLVVPVQKGRNKHHYLNPVPIQQIADRWLDKFRHHEASALIQLQQDIQDEIQEEQQ